MIGLIDSDNKRCFCFVKEEIFACNDDEKCQLNNVDGCANKNINDYDN